MTSTDNQSGLRLHIGDDRMLATLWVEPAAHGGAVPRQAALDLLAASGLRLAPNVLEVLRKQPQSLTSAMSLIVARGQRPAAGAWRIELCGSSDSPAASHYERSSLRTATEGQIIAVLAEPSDEQLGCDVFGQPLLDPAKLPRPLLGECIKLAGDGRSLIALRGGIIQLHENRLHIDEALEVLNVDFSTGNIDFAGDVLVRQNIQDLFKVRCGGNLHVMGVIEAAEIHCQKDLHVGGGILGRDKGKCVVVGRLLARHLTGANASAHGDVVVELEIAQSKVASGGQVIVENGTILGGRISANGGVLCRHLGSAAQVPTHVEAGIDFSFQQSMQEQLPDIEAQQKKAELVRQKVQPLLKNQKMLTAQQKEKATELLYEADEAQKAVSLRLHSLRQAMERAARSSCAQISVRQQLHPGVTVRLGDLQTTIRTAIQGPLKIVQHSDETGRRLVLIDDAGGRLSLDSHAVPDPTLARLTALLAATPPAAE